MLSTVLIKGIRVRRVEGFSLYTAYATARFWGVAKFRDSQVTLIGCQPLSNGYCKSLSLNTLHIRWEMEIRTERPG